MWGYRGVTRPAELGDEAIAAASDGLDEAGVLGRVTQCFSNLGNCFVEAVIEVYDRVWPELATQFFPGQQLTRPLEQHGQQLKGLLLQPDTFAAFCQFAGSDVGFKNSKTQTFVLLIGLQDTPLSFMATLTLRGQPFGSY